MRCLILVLLIAFCGGGCAHVMPPRAEGPRFQFKRDTFAFANETVWDYGDGDRAEKPRQLAAQGGRADGSKYSRRCFIMARSAVQFWKFARFDPNAARLPEKELVERIRELSDVDVWRNPYPREKEIVFPGYRNLFEMSAREIQPLQDNIGLGWPTYVRLGNFCMVVPPSRAHQERTNRELEEWLTRNQPMILWLCNFPSLEINHAVVVYKRRVERGGQVVYDAYDPNYPDRPKLLGYDPARRQFTFEKTFYFPGGDVSVRPVYLSPLQ